MEFKSTQEELIYLSGYVDGSRAQAKLMYNDDEVEEIAKESYSMGRNNTPIKMFNEWFKKFKKCK